jgi:hypothetical protein
LRIRFGLELIGTIKVLRSQKKSSYYKDDHPLRIWTSLNVGLIIVLIHVGQGTICCSNLAFDSEEMIGVLVPDILDASLEAQTSGHEINER